MSQKLKVTIPQSGCPKGSIIDVIHIQEDRTAVGINASNEYDSTLYYIPQNAYKFIEFDSP
ncbi:hypothetical protein GCM10023310_68750 [Paenibacillus vulneris]